MLRFHAGGVLVALAAVLAVVALTSGASAHGSPADGVSIASSAEPRMTPGDVVAIVLDRLGPDATVSSVRGVARASDVPRFEAYAAIPLGQEADIGPVWVVRAKGRFIQERHPAGVAPVESVSGYFVIADADGGILEMGMP